MDSAQVKAGHGDPLVTLTEGHSCYERLASPVLYLRRKVAIVSSDMIATTARPDKLNEIGFVKERRDM
ncbi:hypothetical protein ABIF97_004055 [Bradyrhizobium japonicum]